jgi:hypothetical protein
MMRATGIILLLLAALPAHAASFSDGFVPPASKQGITEFRTELPAAALAERTRRLARFGTGYVQVNLFWSDLESAEIPSSTAPLACPEGHRMEPSSEAERVRLGFHRFHCIDARRVATYDAMFREHEALGIQSGAVLWSSPALYRDPGCEGSAAPIGKQSCAPRPDALNDFEDYLNLVASRWRGGGAGKLSHFILWNENAAPEWFDLSPAVPKDDLSPESIERRIDAYAAMVRRAHAALARHQHAALLYVSTDPLWVTGLRPGHMGSRRLLEGLWDRLGTDYTWSVAVHPYGRVNRPAPPGHYTFANLGMVAAFQEAQLRARGVTDPETWPQMRLIASEQGWGLRESGGRTGQAEQICRAHDAAMRMPSLVVQAHNYFQSIEPEEASPGAKSSQGMFFGLLPHDLPANLDGIEEVPTGAAYLATFDAKAWGRSDGHYCCRTHGLGCAAP